MSLIGNDNLFHNSKILCDQKPAARPLQKTIMYAEKKISYTAINGSLFQ
jgi:hypothetical protein